MKLNIKELLDFFDDKKNSRKGDANALMAIFGEDLNASVYKNFRKHKVEILEKSVSQGLRKEKRLDRWILDKKNRELFQCEIKNWAATAIGGRQLRSNASNEEIKEVSTYNWRLQLENIFSKKVKHPNKVTKVLLEMKTPTEHKDILNIKPLLIYWMPISSDKKGLCPESILSIKPLRLPIKTNFSKLYIFSVSLYLRQLYKKGKGQKFIDLDMPHFEHRIEILTKFQNKI